MTPERLVFDFTQYKSYLLHRLDSENGLGSGGRSRLCKAMGCQSAYLSQVLNGNAHLSFEQADCASRYLGHDDDESEYFLLLLQWARAGTPSLRKFTEVRLARLREGRKRLKTRLKIAEKLTLEQKLRYYSSWSFAAVHVLTTIPEFRAAPAIARKLGIELAQVKMILEFLVGCGLVDRRGTEHEATTLRIHLGDDESLVASYHTNWRTQAIRAIEKNRPSDFHYSSAVTLAKADIPKARELLLRTVESVKSLVKESPAQDLRCFSLDWFEP